MQSIHIKQEVNSDDEDYKRLLPHPKEYNSIFKNKSNAREENCVKKEIVFDGLPKKLQIQLLPGALKKEAVLQEETLTVNAFLEPSASNYNIPPNLNRDRNFSCALCAKKIGTRGGLLYHIKAHMSGRPYKCDICNRSYATKNDFETHYKRHAGNIFTCDYCSKNFAVKDYLLLHIRAKHFPKVFPCSDCKKVKYFASERDLKRHYSEQRSKILAKINARFECKLCKMRFAKLREYTKHCAGRELLSYKCKICFKTFSCHKLLREHAREEIKAAFCKICKTDVKSYKNHVIKYHTNNTCGICKKFESTNYSEFNKHTKYCGTETQVQALGHSCTICQQYFRTKVSLNIHLNSKHPNVWCVKCSKSIHSELLLKEHIRLHDRMNGKVHYKCILCVPHKNFYAKHAFDAHFHLKHGSGRFYKSSKFTCIKCKRSRKTKREFVKHISECFRLKKTAKLIFRRSLRINH